ncbi:NAD-P-binding protein [Dendrothele bispora CBS 962.96]|uniref:NAD-P-binding protein n=1 Tax=Dendrothele bispora (strain CBS 962.96) TaxID=1314807 RepID=A0A4S8LZH0_DENBC|nr:NAD-P-binding protein [Dendrothele bispora CBS 962.96]
MTLPEISRDIAFVTGAASGFGFALSKELVSRGASVIMTDINEDGCKKAVAEINEKAGKTAAIAIKVDTTRFEDQLAAYEIGKETFGRVDMLSLVFANAGISEHPWIPVFDPTTSSSRPITKPNTTTLDVTLDGQLNTAALAFQVFERQEPNPRTGFRGKLVITSSIIGFWPCKGAPLYSTAKAGVVSFMRTMAGYYGDKGITVNLIAPNVTATPIVPPDFLALLGDTYVCPLELVIEQMISVLGSCKDNGRAICISGKETWDHIQNDPMFEKNRVQFEKMEYEFGKGMGLWE